jgi:hypothetical protein
MLFAGNLTKHPCFDEMRAAGTGYRVIGNLEVTDRIILGYDGNDKLAAIIAKNSEFLASEVLASEVKAGLGANTKEWSVNGEKITLSVDKV